jgi:signal transduction histidine kinase
VVVDHDMVSFKVVSVTIICISVPSSRLMVVASLVENDHDPLDGHTGSPLVFMRSISLWLLPVIALVMLLGHITLIYSGARHLKFDLTSAVLYLTATGSVILSGIYNILAQSIGLVSTDINPLFPGVLIEVSLLSSALILKYGQVQRERSRLKNELTQQHNKMFQQHIEGIEKERNHIAGELHDNIGSKLSNIKRSLFSNELDEGAKRMGAIIDEVRQLSHDLAPTIAKVSGLMPVVEKLITEARSASEVDIKLHSFGFKENLPVESVVQAYRIVQEVLNNIVNHSKAKRADVQFFGYDHLLVVTIEDDGVGFNPTTQSGFGINSLRARAALLKGKIEINSTPGKGCLIVVEIPIAESKAKN